MNATATRLAGLCALGLALAAPVRADSLASSASSAGSASSGSISDSLNGSSNSSSPAKTAEGDYRVIEVADVAARPGMLRLTLQGVDAKANEGPLWLTLPQKALAGRPIVAGDFVSARQRPYGIEFARAAGNAQAAPAREAFFLVLADDWVSDLAPRAIGL